MKLILVSTSERRKEILKLLGLPFEIVAPLYEEETLSELTPYEEASRFSKEKVRSVLKKMGERGKKNILIGSDTLIEYQGMKIGKPKDINDAQKILKTLRGETHDILTGLTMLNTETGVSETHVEIVRIKMKNVSDETLTRYLEEDSPLDKAGAYSLQGKGRELIDELKGDYLAAVGLPLRPIAKFLNCCGMHPKNEVEKIYQEKHFMNWRTYS